MSTLTEVLGKVAGNSALNDGKVTLDDAIALDNLIKPVIIAASNIEAIRDLEDTAIDRIEAFAVKKGGLKKRLILLLTATLRSTINCPDDDDNTVQK